MAKQAMLFDFHNMAFKNFWWGLANKNPSGFELTYCDLEI